LAPLFTFAPASLPEDDAKGVPGAAALWRSDESTSAQLLEGQGGRGGGWWEMC